jgi:hypothetical protein
VASSIELSDRWQGLDGFEAMTGMLMSGWSHGAEGRLATGRKGPQNKRRRIGGANHCRKATQIMEKADPPKVIFATLLVAAFGTVIGAAASDTASVAGQWNLTVQSPNASSTPTVTFSQDGETLTGTYGGASGGGGPAMGTIKGNNIRFLVPSQPNGVSRPIEFVGTVEGTTMKGKVTIRGMEEGTFTGTQSASAGSDPGH